MLSKLAEINETIGQIGDGARVMIGGFGVPGTPFMLIEALVAHGAKDLTVIKNDANEAGMGVDWLLEAGLVSKLITSHIGLNARALKMKNAGEIEVEFVPQGILAERIRIGGAGLPAFLSDIGIGTQFEEGKAKTEFEGKSYLIEPAIRADFALLHAARADERGNLFYDATARNFNPIMAMAADYVIAEAECVIPSSAENASNIHTPAPFVDSLVLMPEIKEVYGVIRR